MQKVGSNIGAFADGIMIEVIKLFNSKRSSGVHEVRYRSPCRCLLAHHFNLQEAFLTVSAIANAVGKDFIKYMGEFEVHLNNGLANWKEYQVGFFQHVYYFFNAR